MKARRGKRVTEARWEGRGGRRRGRQDEEEKEEWGMNGKTWEKWINKGRKGR